MSFRDLTEGRELKVILAFSLPMFVGYVFQQLYNVVDMAVLGRLIGTEALAASGASFPLLFFWMSIMQGLASAFTIVSSHFYGKKEFFMLPDVLFNSLLISVVIGLIVVFLGLVTAPVAFGLMGIEGELFSLTMEYYEILLYGSFFMSGYFLLVGIMRGLGDSQTPLYLGIVSNLLNLTMDIIFVRYLNLGIWGVALATDLAFIIVFFVSIIILSKKINDLGFNKPGEINKSIIKEVFSLGLPNIFGRLVNALSIFVFFIFVGVFGKDIFASYAAASRAGSLALSPAVIFSAAITAFVGQNYGAKKKDRIVTGFGQAVIIILVFSLFFSVVFCFLPEAIMHLFSTDISIITYGKEYLQIISFFFLFYYSLQLFFGLLKGLGNTVAPMRITWFYVFVLQLPLAYFLAFKLFTFQPVNVKGLWWALPLSWIGGFIISLFLCLKKCKKIISF